MRIGYVYGGVYDRTERFGTSGNRQQITGSQTRQEVVFWREHKQMIGGWDGGAPGLGGWTLNVQHAYDPVGQVLYLGNGQRRGGQGLSGPGQSLRLLAGTGKPEFNGDGAGNPRRAALARIARHGSGRQRVSC